MLGLDAPKSLKEKLAAQNEPPSATKIVSKKKEKAVNRSDKEESEEDKEDKEDSDDEPQEPLFGENTIEYHAVKKIME